MNCIKETIWLLGLLLLLAACTRSEPTVPLPHEMPPLETAVPWQSLPVSHSLLEPTDLSDGRRGAACPVAQPFFCLYAGSDEQVVASLSFSALPLARNQILSELLEEAGLVLGHTPQSEAAYRQTARAVLTEMAEITLAGAVQNAPDQSVSALPRQPVAIGPLPGIALGEMVQNEAGEVVDYVRHYAAFDGNVLYWLELLPAERGGPMTPAEAAGHWQPLETAAVELLSHLLLPVPVVASELEAVRVEMMVAITALPGEGFIQHLQPGNIVTVIGQSHDGNWLYITCPENSLTTSCWIPNDRGRVRPR